MAAGAAQLLGGQRTDDARCTAGVLSTAGWAVYNDATNQVRTASGGWAPSAHAAHPGDVDLTVFLYGRDYRGALADLSRVSGALALPPRRFFGVWWSRWQKYSTGDFQRLTQDYEDAALPLDGINIDTEWHANTDYIDGATPGKRSAYYSGVYDWDESLYPNVPKMVDWLRARGLWPVWIDVHRGPRGMRTSSGIRTLDARARVGGRAA